MSDKGGGKQPSEKDFQAIQKAIARLELAPEPQEQGPKEHKFWKTQPVPQPDEDIEEDGAIEPAVPIEELQQEPYELPPGFVWSTIDLNDDKQLDELYNLLYKNYVEDTDAMFRFDYSRDFLKWALQPPGWKQVWHCGVRNATKGNLLAFISAIPATIRLREHQQLMVEINFLCVHKKLRAKRLAAVLIKEITRRVNLEGIFQATYTAGMVIPTPIASCQYWHRSLNPQKLVDIKFSSQPRGMTMNKLIRKYKLPSKTDINLVRMEERHCEQAFELLAEYLKKFDYAPVYTLEEFKHWMLTRERVINSFVMEDEEGNVRAFTSFYTLPSTIVQSTKYKTLWSAYSYYSCSNHPDVSLEDLVRNALIKAKELEFDVFNALDLMDNKSFLESLLFGPGDGNLQYYLYNYKFKPIEPAQVGVVLL